MSGGRQARAISADVHVNTSTGAAHVCATAARCLGSGSFVMMTQSSHRAVLGSSREPGYSDHWYRCCTNRLGQVHSSAWWGTVRAHAPMHIYNDIALDWVVAAVAC
ncbi:hypothetical protein Vretifemale_2889 [Volvox reticuliferus]|uniref:Uncharacterized protein n=1 Tax=Volvox reticuliferus TaxID=1737510 RepID=A0A8J4C1X4_9CHLO|nr:hypothetical protein Vretifemale_2889 [Volvox reticuliferus]